MTEFLQSVYLWLKAAHIIFVIFWMAGMFLFPRFLVYHQEGLADPAECARWIEREDKLRQIILTPSMILVWLLGLALAQLLGAWSEGWLHAKLAIVLALSAYHGWMIGYAKKLRKEASTRLLTGRQLRLINEVPGLATILIVLLVILKPF
jgi:protoporphyrinogen IX oxidase